VKVKYPYDVFFVFFDHSSGHTAYADDISNVSKRNVRPGGAQPKMRDTINLKTNRVQKVVFANGNPKEMKQILFGRGVNATKMKADDMRKAVKKTSDFKYKRLKLCYIGMASQDILSPSSTVNSTL